MASIRESAFLRFFAEAAEHLDEVRDADKAAKIATRLAREVFAADEAVLARAVPGRPRLQPVVLAPSGARWDLELLARYLGKRRPKMPPGTLIAPVRRFGRPWAVLALRRAGAELDRDAVRDVVRVCETIARSVARIDDERIAEVRHRIDRKVLEQLRPKDLFYQILHGLQSLTRYDHSAAVLIQADGAGPLRVVAEQIKWRKGKSQRVGLRRALGDEARAALEEGSVLGFDRVGGRWREWRGRASEALADALDYNRDVEDERSEQSLLCAPLATGDGILGVIKVASCHPGSMGPYEARLVARFLPQAAVAIRNLERTVTLESGVLAAEKKHVLANLARGVSHDVNNAFGSVLPLVQQMIVDAREGKVDALTLAADLAQIETSLQVCRRIFGGMLSFARSTAAGEREGDLRRAIEGTLSILQESMRRHLVDVTIECASDPPLVRGTQGDLEQLLLNLATNARDAMPDGGRLAIRVRADGDAVEIELADTGCGIAPAHIERITEPFFTTKSNGSGLGLSICRSIVWNMRGQMKVTSELGAGTRVRLRLPSVHAEGAR